MSDHKSRVWPNVPGARNVELQEKHHKSIQYFSLQFAKFFLNKKATFSKNSFVRGTAWVVISCKTWHDVMAYELITLTDIKHGYFCLPYLN